MHPLQLSRGYFQTIASVLNQLANEDDKLTCARMCVLNLVHVKLILTDFFLLAGLSRQQ